MVSQLRASGQQLYVAGVCGRASPVLSGRVQAGSRARSTTYVTILNVLGSVGIKDVATAAGVSLGTVSHVLNHPDRVSPETRDRVLAAIEQLGFVRNGSASRLRANASKAVGVVVLDAANPFFAEVSRGIESVLDEYGYIGMLSNSDGNPAREEKHLRFLEEQRVAGVLISPTASKSALARIDALRNRGVSVVLVDEPEQRSTQCSVAVDDVRGGELAGRHLLEIGRRRIVFVSGPDDLRQLEDRRRGLRLAVADAAEVHLVTLPAMNSRAGYGSVGEVLGYEPDAVFCGNDIVALGLLRGLIERNVNVPNDIALIGYDDIEFAEQSAIPLTSIRQPAYGLGRAAAALLIEECTDPDHQHRQVIFQPELVVRRSTSS